MGLLQVHTQSYFLPLFQGPSFWPEPALGGSHVPLLMSPVAWGCPCVRTNVRNLLTPTSHPQPFSHTHPHSSQSDLHILHSYHLTAMLYQPTSFTTSAHGTQLHPSQPPPTHSLSPSQPPTLTASPTHSLPHSQPLPLTASPLRLPPHSNMFLSYLCTRYTLVHGGTNAKILATRSTRTVGG